MDDSTLLRNSSLFIAYMGCLGWEALISMDGDFLLLWLSMVDRRVGVDDVALKFVLCCERYRYIPYWMGSRYCFLFRHKTKNNIQNLSFIRLFLAILLLLFRLFWSFRVIHQHVEPDAVVFVLLLPLQLRFCQVRKKTYFSQMFFGSVFYSPSPN